MPKDDWMTIASILDSARKVEGAIAGKRRGDFDQDKPLQRELVTLLQRIGEAARHVSPDFQQRFPDIPWSSLIGMQHKSGLNVDPDTVWQTIREDLPSLISNLETLISSSDIL
jgi:uncharacterized protein with HEPN domain